MANCIYGDGLMAHWPFTLDKIKNNIIADQCEIANNYTIAALQTWNTFGLANLSFGAGFDFMASSSTTGQTLATFNPTTQIVTYSACGANCDRCFNNTHCFVCATNFVLRDHQCFASSSYYARFPSNNNLDVTLPTAGLTDTGYTFTMFMKVYEFNINGGSEEFLTFGASASVSFVDDKTSADKGLNVHDSTPQKLMQHETFLDLIGRWVFFSISYYDDATTTSHYPAMLLFQVNQTRPLTLVTPVGLNFKTLTVKNTFRGLISRVHWYNDFILAPYGHVFNSNGLATVAAPANSQFLNARAAAASVTNADSELTNLAVGDSVNFVFDGDFFFTAAGVPTQCTGATEYLNYNYLTGTTCPINAVTSCRQLAYGPGTKDCTCYMNNGKNEMFFYNGSNEYYCYCAFVIQLKIMSISQIWMQFQFRT